MNKDAIMELINLHNEVVDFIDTVDNIRVSLDVIFKFMPLANNLSKHGLQLTEQARAMGINAKCCMQSGKVRISALKMQ